MSKDDLEFLQQPFLTEEGFVNPACMNELESVIRNTLKSHERLSEDPEWSIKRWTLRKNIVGYFAMWTIRQSMQGPIPNGLERVCGYLNESLKSVGEWEELEDMAMIEVSLCEINKWLYDILYEQGVELFNKWNEGEFFISLDALLHNVCISIRDERRRDDAFNKEFERKHHP